MKLQDLEGWKLHYWPESEHGKWMLEWKRRNLIVSDCDSGSSIEIEFDGDYDRGSIERAYVPVAALVNALRVAGWTVTPEGANCGPALVWCSNGEAGDGQHECTLCDREPLDVEHSWEDCAKELRGQRDSADECYWTEIGKIEKLRGACGPALGRLHGLPSDMREAIMGLLGEQR